MDLNSKSKQELIHEINQLRKQIIAQNEVADVQNMHLDFEKIFTENVQLHNRITSLLITNETEIDEKLQVVIDYIYQSFCQMGLHSVSLEFNHKLFTTGEKPQKVLNLEFPVESNFIKNCRFVLYFDSNFSFYNKKEMFVSLFRSLTNRIIGIIDLNYIQHTLKTTSEKYKNFVENINDIIYEYDQNGIITFISPVIYKSFGYNPEKIIGRDFDQILGINEQFRRKKLDELKKNHSTLTEYQMVDAFNKQRWVLLSTNAIYNKGVFAGGIGILTDITERKLYEEKLFNSEERYRQMVERINDVVFEIRNDGIIKFVGPSIQKILGYSQDELVGKNFFSYLYEEDKPLLYEALKDLQNKDSSHLEYRYYKKDKTLCWMRSSTVPVLDADGNMIGGLGVLYNINEQKISDEKLRKSEEKYRQIFNTIQDAYYETTFQGTLLEISPSITYVTNGLVSPEDVVGLSIKDLYLNPFEREQFQNEILKKGQVVDYDIDLKFGNLILPVSVSSKIIFDSEGKPHKIVGVIRDISERKKAESELKSSETLYRSILKSSPDNITLTDARGQILVWSENGAKMFGFEDSKDFSNHSIFDFIDISDRQRAITNFKNKLKSRKGDKSSEYRASRADGTLFYIEVSWEPIIEENNTIEKIIFVVRDITARKETENKIREVEEKYRRLIEHINEVVYDFDVDGTIKYISPSITQISGFLPEEIVGMKMYELLGESYEQFSSRKNSLIKNNKQLREVNIKNKKGEDRWIRFSTNAIYKNNEFAGASGTLIDITENKLTELELQRSEALHSTILNVSPDAIILADMTGIVTYVSPAVFKIYHSDNLNDYIGRNLFDFMIDSDKERAIINTKARLAGKYVGLMEYTGIRKDGTEFYFDADSETVKDQAGNPVSILYVIRDITQKKIVEKNLKESENRYRLITDKISDVVWMMDIHGRSTFVSPSVEKFTGYTIPEYLNQSIKERFTPNSAILAELTFKREIQKATYGSVIKDYSVTIELDYKCKDGNVKTGELLITPIYNNENQLEGLHGVTRDITQRKIAESALRESEEKYRQIFETVQDAYYEASIDGIILEISPSIKNISKGVLTRENFKGKSFVDLYADINDRHRLQQELNNHGFVNDFEIMFHKDNLTIPVSISSTLIFDKFGNPVKITGSIRDISERKKAEQKLRESEALFQSLMNTSPDEIVIADVTGNLIMLSSKGYELLKIDKNIPVSGYNIFDFVDKNDLEFAHEKLIQLFNDSFIYSLEISGLDLEGRVFPMEVNGAVKFDVDGKPQNLVFIVRDITNRKLAEEQLRLSELRYKTFFEGNKSTMLLLDPDTGEIRDANPAATEYYGWTKEEICKMNISQINTLSKDQLSIEMLNAKKEKRKMFMFQHRKADGTVRDVEVYSGPMIFEDHVLLYSIVHDVTERKQIEAKLRESESRFRMIFDNAFDGICIFEENDDPAKRKLIECNEQYAIMAGRTKEELLKSGDKYSLTDYLETDIHEKRKNAILNMSSYSGSYKWKRPDGKDNIIQFVARPILINDKVYSIGIDRDVTEAKANEYQLRKLSQAVEQSPVSIVITDLEGNIEYANPQACKTTGYTLKELIGQNPRVLQSGETLKHEYLELWDKLTQGKEWHGMFHNKKKNGELYWESSTVAPIFAADGKVINYIAVKEDVTEKKKAEEELVKFRNISDNANYGTAIAKINGEILYVNQTYAQMHGFSIDELIGKNISILHTREQQHTVNSTLKVMQGEGAFTAEVWHVHKDGTEFPTLMSSTYIYNDKNEPVMMSATAIDITEMKKAENALKLSEHDLNFAQKIAQMGSWELDFNENIVKWSENEYTLFGLEPFAEVNLDDYFYSHIYPDDLDNVLINTKLRLVDNTADKSAPLTYQFRFVMPDQSIKWIKGDAIPVIQNDKVTGMKGTNIDITRQKEIEELIRNSESNLNFAQEIAKMGSWEVDFLTHEMHASRNYYKIHEINPEVKSSDLIKFTRERIHPDDREIFEDSIQKVMKRNETHSIEARLLFPDGRISWIKGYAIPEFKDDKLVGIKGVNIDITEHKLAEIAIRNNEKELNFAQEIAKMGSWVFNIKTGKMTGSRNYYRMHNLDPEINRDDLRECIFNLIHPDDIEYAKNLLVEYANSSQKGAVNIKMLFPDNEIRWYQYNIVPVFENNELIALNGVNIDITSGKKSSDQIAKLSLAVTQSPVAVIITDTNGDVEFVNPAFKVITGYSLEDLLGKSTRVLKSGKNDPKMYIDLWQNITAGKQWETEWINKRKGGELYWEHITISPLVNEEGKITNYLAVKQDISERKKFENEILKLNNTLEHKVEERTSQLEKINKTLTAEIIERKKFEIALSESEQKYRSVVENIQEVIFQTNTEGNWVFLNQPWENITGFTVTESIGQLFLNYVHPDDRQRNLDLFEPLIKREKDYCKHEIRYLTKSGGYCWIEVFARLGIDENDQVIGTYGSLRDITERKRAEEFEREMLQLSAQISEVKLNESDSAVNIALSRIGNFLNADRSYIFEFSSSFETMSNTFEWCNDNILPEIENLKDLPVNLFPNWMRLLKKNENVIIPSVADLSEDWQTEKEILEPQGIQSLVSLPLVYENQLIGFVGLDSVREKRNFTNAEINILKVWGTMLTTLLVNKRNLTLLELARLNFEVFFNTSDDFLWVLDEEGNIVHVNETVLNRLGYSFSEINNKSILEVHPEELRNEAAIVVADMLQGNKNVCSFPLLTKSGGRIPVETRIKNGSWNGRSAIFGVSKDISQIQLSEQKFATAFQANSALMTISTLKDNVFLDVNDAFLNAMHFSREDVIGKTNIELQVFNEKELFEKIEENLKVGKPIKELEVTIRNRKNEELVLLLTSENITIGDEPCVLTVGVNISDRKKAEELLQWNKTLLEMMSNSSPLGFLVVDNRTDDILYFNKRFCEIWGIEQLEEQMKQGEFKNNDIIPYCIPVLTDVQAFADSCKPLQDEINRVVVSDEIPFINNRTIHRYSTQIRGTDDKYYGRFYIFEDITEEKMAQQELKNARNEAEKANVAKSEFLSRMSHELRTPMNSILGFTQLLEMSELTANQQKGVGHILRSGKHLLNLINEVLDISRIESGRLSISLEPVYLQPVVREMLDIMIPLSTKNGIEIITEMPVDRDIYILADHQSLKQILLNLLNNAVKYNRPNGKVTVSTELNNENNHVRIKIADTGMGIAPDDIQKLFMPFERVGAELTTIEGTGLGLAVVKKLVEAMGGKLGVSSVLDEGSVFWIEFSQTENPLNKFDSTSLNNSNSSDLHKKGKILYIEDNQSNVELVEQILSLQRPGITIISEINGRNGIRLAHELKPDLILLDLNLPDIHGSKVIKELLENPETANIPVVVVSADAMQKQVQELIRLGARTYLTKPIEVNSFLHVIDEYLI